MKTPLIKKFFINRTIIQTFGLFISLVSLAHAQANPKDGCGEPSPYETIILSMTDPDLDSPWEPVYQRCGTGQSTSTPFSMTCTIPATGDDIGPLPCTTFAGMDLNKMCRENAVLGSDPTTAAGACASTLWKNTCPGLLPCVQPTCFRCALNPNRACQAYAIPKGGINQTTIPQFQGKLTLNGAGMCTLNCKSTAPGGTYTMTGDCVCDTGCRGC